MALQITNWNLIKKILFIIDITILSLNIILLSFISYILYTEYYYRRTLKLFFAPFILSLINVIIDIIMNKTNYIMKYAGHNRYGMLIRFFMFYLVIIMIIYADQRAKYIIKETINNIKIYAIYFGIIDVSLIVISMVFGFCVIDVQSFKQILVKKRKRRRTKISEEDVNSLQKMEFIDM